jgi:hypothetical protein
MRCIDCVFFVKDKIGSGHGIGKCRVFEHYKKKNIGQSQTRELLLTLGNTPDNVLFWGGLLDDRNCQKYEDKRRG